MGAYLNKPVTEKIHDEGEGYGLRFACTSMQGWRINQEDAHNCVLNVHDGWHMFAVYDGHGGCEVSQYTSENFPSFLKDRKFWESEDVKSCLQNVFIDFDDLLRSPKVLKELAKIANNEQDRTDQEVSEDELDRIETIEESAMPLEELLRRYGYNRFGQGLTEESKSILSSIVVSNRPENNKEVNGQEQDAEKKSAKRLSKSPVQQSQPKKVKTAEEGSKENESAETTTEKSIDSSQSGDAVTASDTATEETEKSDTNDVTSASQDKSPLRKKDSSSGQKKESSEADVDDSEDEDFVEEDEVEGEEDDEEDEDEQSDEDESNGGIFIGGTGETPGEDSGTTACVCLLKKDSIVVANVGDSRAVICRDGKAIDLSVDHKPEDEIERTRINTAGGTVEDGRVNGGLNLSRALGDHCYKKNADLPLKDQMISAFPDVMTEKVTEQDEFLVVACDGIWNSLESQQVVDFVRERLKEGKDVREICDALCDHCLAESTAGDGTGCDNMTVIIAVFTR